LTSGCALLPQKSLNVSGSNCPDWAMYIPIEWPKTRHEKEDVEVSNSGYLKDCTVDDKRNVS